LRHGGAKRFRIQQRKRNTVLLFDTLLLLLCDDKPQRLNLRICELYAIPFSMRKPNAFCKLFALALRLFKLHALPFAVR